MKAIELLSLLECVGHLALSEEFQKVCGAYDNSGIMVDTGEDIRGVLFSLDLSRGALEEAEKRNFNAIVTHHPAIFGGIKNISVSDPASSLVAACARRGIAVISMHLNFDAAPEGIDYNLMLGLGGTAAKTMIKLDGGAYGRVYDVKEISFGEYARKVAAEFGTKKMIKYGSDDKKIRRVASFCGAGCDDGAINFAAAEGADAFVSSDFKHHMLAALLARNINVIQLTHYSAENYGFRKIYLKIIEGLNVPAAYFCDENFM